MIVITSIGLASSMGDSAPAMAAARAGISRPVPLEPEGLGDRGEEAPVAMGHVCPEAAGTRGYGRLETLLLSALGGAFSGADPSLLADSRSGLVVVLPLPPDRPSLRQMEEGNRKPHGGLMAALLERLGAVGGLPIHESRCQLLEAGHAGVFGALAEVMARIRSGQLDRVVLAAADSLIEEANVQWLADSHRLRAGSDPGLSPGEGAGVLLLERENAALLRGAWPLARITRATFEAAAGSDAPMIAGFHGGNALQRALTGCLEGGQGVAVGALLHDGNGEVRRTRHLWSNLQALEPSFRSLWDTPQWLIAEHFGDLGAATGAFQLCSAVRAFQRGYAPGEGLLLCATSDDGSSGAALVMGG